jgi:hypothetical protein
MGWREAAADSVQPSNHRRAQRSKLGPPKPPESATKRSGGTGRDVRQLDRDTSFPVGKIPLRLFEKFPRLRRLVGADGSQPASPIPPHARAAPNSPMRMAFSSSSTRMSPTAAAAATSISGQSIGLVS